MKTEIENQKSIYEAEGQEFGAVGAIITLIVGVGVSVLVLIFVGALGGQTYNLVEDNIDSIGNSSASTLFTASNTSAVSLGHSYVHSGEITMNVTLGNFTIDYTAGTALLTGTMSLNGKVIQANYTYGDTAIRTDIKEGITSGFSALKQTGDYLPIIVLAVVISLVMFLVLGMSGMGNGGSRTAL